MRGMEEIPIGFILKSTFIKTVVQRLLHLTDNEKMMDFVPITAVHQRYYLPKMR